MVSVSDVKLRVLWVKKQNGHGHVKKEINVKVCESHFKTYGYCWGYHLLSVISS